jgi:branched-chain amino acid transport system permease protein
MTPAPVPKDRGRPNPARRVLQRVLSDDLPPSAALAVLLLAILAGLLVAPFLFPSTRALATAGRIAIFIALAASYDLLLGYVGMVSFTHTMFFGIGAYATAIALSRMGPSFMALGVGAMAGVAATTMLALVIGLVSLRVRAIFFAMVTLAIATAFATLVSRFSAITGGENGLNYRIPDGLTAGFQMFPDPLFGVTIDGRLLAYYTIVGVSLALFLTLLRVVNSPFGRVLQAIRENAARAEAIGYRVVAYRTTAVVVAAVAAAIAGVLQALWLRYTGPATTLSLEIMIDVLLMVVIGGMGTLYGAAIGAVLLVVAQNYLQDLLTLAAGSTAAVPLLANALQPGRWLLWLGVLFILSVYFFPSGIVGRLRQLRGD